MTAADLIALLIETTLASSAAVLLVMLLRRPLRAMFGAGVAYAVWGLVPAALIAVLLPAATVAVAPMPTSIVRATVMAVPAAIATPAITVAAWVCAAWLLGVIVCLLRFVWQQHRFTRSLGRVQRRDDGLHQAEAIAGLPAAIGVLRPRIVLPADYATRYSDEQQRLMQAHERTHVARGDLQINTFAAALRCVFWFNPLLHYAARHFRHDQELACDQRVIARHPHARRAYGEAMFKTQLAAQPLPLGCHWGHGHPLKERIEMLKQPVPTMKRVLGGSVLVVALALTGGYAAWAAQPKQAVAATVPAGMIDTRVQLRIDGGKPDTSHFVISAEGGSLVMNATRDGQRWEVKGNVSREAMAGKGDLLMFAATITQDGKVVGTPKIGVLSGKPGTITVGEVVHGKNGSVVGFKGIELMITLTEAAQSPAVKATAAGISVRAAALQIAANAGWRIANPEVLSDTRMVSFKFDGVPAATAMSLIGEEADLGAKIDGSELRFIPVVPAKDGSSANAARDSRILNPPKYPKAAAKQGVGGSVLLVVDIDVNGVPTKVEVEKAEPAGVFNAAAIEAAKKWRFNPETKGGKPVAGRIRVPVSFEVHASKALKPRT